MKFLKEDWEAIKYKGYTIESNEDALEAAIQSARETGELNFTFKFNVVDSTGKVIYTTKNLKDARSYIDLHEFDDYLDIAYGWAQIAFDRDGDVWGNIDDLVADVYDSMLFYVDSDPQFRAAMEESYPEDVEYVNRIHSLYSEQFLKNKIKAHLRLNINEIRNNWKNHTQN